jgi:transmembrane sensor
MEDKYKDYSATDLAADYNFVQWIKNPDSRNDAQWQQWLQKNPQMRSTVNEARLLVRSVAQPEYPGIQQSIDHVWQRIKSTNAQELPVIPETPERSATPVWWRWAAVFIGFLMLAGGVLYTIKNQPQEYQTAYGETMEVDLPDGSIVTLNANSTLRLGSWETEREVWLHGEAFFSVKKQQLKSRAVKFVVHTADVDVSVLGTKFTVSDHQTTTVVLNEGKIQLTRGNENILMNPGELVEILKDQDQMVKRTVDPKVYSSWKDKEWILDGLTIKEVAKRLENTFGMKVMIKKEPNATTKVTGVVPTDNLDRLLTALSAVFELEFKRKGNQIVIE